MRILHVFPSFEVGGQQMRMVTLANAFAAEDMVHVIVSLHGSFEAKERILPGVEVEMHLPRLSGRAGIVRRARAIRREIRQIQPDLLLTYNWGAIEWAASNCLPAVRHIHVEDGFGPEEAAGPLLRRSLFRRVALSGRSDVIVPSRTLYNIARTRWHLPAFRLHYIPNGIDLGPYGSVDRRRAREELGLPADGPVIGTLATLRREKNLQRLLKAFCEVRELLPDARLVIAGDGPERLDLESFAGSLGVSEAVLFTGHIMDPHRFLPALDVFALSSDTEQMPLSVIEAMAAGLPVASVDVGDVRQMVAQCNQEFVREKSAPVLARTILDLIKSPDLCRKLGSENARHARGEFGIEAMLASWKALITKT